MWAMFEFRRGGMWQAVQLSSARCFRRVAGGRAQPRRDAREVALLADGVAQFGRQPAGIDDGVVGAARRLIPLTPADVQCAGSVAALAADGIALKDRLSVAIDRLANRLDVVAVA